MVRGGGGGRVALHIDMGHHIKQEGRPFSTLANPAPFELYYCKAFYNQKYIKNDGQSIGPFRILLTSGLISKNGRESTVGFHCCCLAMYRLMRLPWLQQLSTDSPADAQ